MKKKKPSPSRLEKRRIYSPWYFLVLAVISGIICVHALRQNNYTMIRLRNAVNSADKANGDTETALRNLREFVYAHMNTNLASGPNAIYPPIQLKYRYERLVAAEKARVDAINSQIYTDAQNECERLYPHSIIGGPRVPCIQDYVTKHGLQEQSIPENLYKFDFVSPLWSPDLAGWSMVISAGFLALFGATYLLERHYRSTKKDALLAV